MNRDHTNSTHDFVEIDRYLEVKRDVLKSPLIYLDQLLNLVSGLPWILAAWLATIAMLHPLLLMAAVRADPRMANKPFSDLTLGEVYGGIAIHVIVSLAFVIVTIAGLASCGRVFGFRNIVSETIHNQYQLRKSQQDP